MDRMRSGAQRVYSDDEKDAVQNCVTMVRQTTMTQDEYNELFLTVKWMVKKMAELDSKLDHLVNIYQQRSQEPRCMQNPPPARNPSNQREGGENNENM